MYNATAKTKRGIDEGLPARVSFLRFGKASNNTNSEFAEFLLHKQSSVSTPDGISKRRLEEVSSDDVSPMAPSKLASTCIVFLQVLNAVFK